MTKKKKGQHSIKRDRGQHAPDTGMLEVVSTTSRGYSPQLEMPDVRELYARTQSSGAMLWFEQISDDGKSTIDEISRANFGRQFSLLEGNEQIAVRDAVLRAIEEKGDSHSRTHASGKKGVWRRIRNLF